MGEGTPNFMAAAVEVFGEQTGKAWASALESLWHDTRELERPDQRFGARVYGQLQAYGCDDPSHMAERIFEALAETTADAET